jgi:hypothetical protein
VVGLADAIASLRQELTAAMLEGKGELQVENKGSVNGGIKWLLVSIGGSAERSQIQTPAQAHSAASRQPGRRHPARHTVTAGQSWIDGAAGSG